MAVCKICEGDLIVELDPDSFDEETAGPVGQTVRAPDDLLLRCGCHFHWQCLLDESPQIALDLACPACQNSIVSTAPGSSTNPQPQVITRYHNEGGIQENLDIHPLIIEEAYLDANPAARPARAFMIMCSEGDVTGIVELLGAIAEDRDEEDMSPTDLLRFQDPLDEGKTGLHVAVEKGQQEVVWLLLWLATGLPLHAFPEEVVQAAQTMGATREFAEGVDVRGLRDEQHRTAEEIAGGMGSTWAGLLAAGVLRG